MSSSTGATTVETLARSIATAFTSGEYATAIELAEQGARDFPNATLPSNATWAKLSARAQQRLDAATPEAAPEPVRKPSPKKTTRKTTPATPVEPVEPATPVDTDDLVTMTIAHTIDGGTVLIGSAGGELGKKISAIMGKTGQRWSFYFGLPTGPGWYIRGSRGGGANMARIEAARAALVAGGFAVTLDIVTTDTDGNTIAPKVSPAAAARLAKDRARTVRALSWHLAETEHGLNCSQHQCGASNLNPTTGVIVDDPAIGLRVVCTPHVGELSVVEQVEQPTAPVLPELDDEQPAEPVKRPTRTAKVAAHAADLSELDGQVLVALILAGNSEEERKAAAAELVGRMGTPAQPAAPPAIEVGADESAPITATFSLTATARARATASDVRRNLNQHVTSGFRKVGAEVHVYLNRDERTITITVSTAGADAATRARIAAKVESVTKRTLGVAELVAA